MIKTTEEYYPIETKINCFGEWDRVVDLNYDDENERNFIIDLAKKSSKTINNYDDFEEFIDDDLSRWCDEDVFEKYCEWLDKKNPNYKFYLHTIHTDDDCFFVMEANKKESESNND